jgi:hypothetical protein
VVAAGRVTVVVVTGTSAVRDTPLSNWLLPWTASKLECVGAFVLRGGDPPKLLAIAATEVIKMIDVARKSENAPLWVESLPPREEPASDRREPAAPPGYFRREIRSAATTDRPIACSTELEPTTTS